VTYHLDFRADGVHRWSLTDDGVRREVDAEWRPTVYLASDALGDLRGYVRSLPSVEATRIEDWRRGFRYDPEPVLAVDVSEPESVTDLARTIVGWGDPGEHRLFDVDLSPGFRYCLDRGLDPTPTRELRTLRLSAADRDLAADHLRAVTVDDERATGAEAAVTETVLTRIAREDPDLLVVSSSRLLARLQEARDRHDVDARLGREPGFAKLAGRSTYESYGRVGHSPARYRVPGRAVVDESNAFLWNRANAAGCLDLVGRSGKPLSELGWASIGNVLTAIQVRTARARGVLVPWRSWRHEFFKTARQLRAADRGGVTLAPAVGFHEDVHELDFASLYPNLIVTRNLSPETVRCDCCTNDAVPGLGYSVCDRRGYLPDVLEPLVMARDRIKTELRICSDPARCERLAGRSTALKWVLVACFGYQGFSNAKFGRIECHEAINAYAREVLLDAKETLEAGGWRVLHGIVDSVWVTPRTAAPTPIAELCSRVTREHRVRLEHEADYEWVTFVPTRDSAAGALTRYVGKRRDGSFKFRGVACRRRSTCEFVAEAQRDLVRTLDTHRDPERVCDRLRTHLQSLRRGAVPVVDLAVTERASKPLNEYDRATRTVAALERARRQGITRQPGESVRYVMVDEGASGPAGVALVDEATKYDAGFYADRLLRAAESVVSPFGWREARIRRYLDEREDAGLAAFG
jgi:DNA polymerase I